MRVRERVVERHRHVATLARLPVAGELAGAGEPRARFWGDRERVVGQVKRRKGDLHFALRDCVDRELGVTGDGRRGRVEQVDVADDARTGWDANGRAVRELLNLGDGLGRLRVEHATEHCGRELVVVTLFALPDPVGSVERRLGDERPVRVVREGILDELDRVDPELGVVVERPALTQAKHLFSGLGREVGEGVILSLATDRDACPGSRRVGTSLAGEALGRSGRDSTRLLLDQARVCVGLGARVAQGLLARSGVVRAAPQAASEHQEQRGPTDRGAKKHATS